jgi:tetratricopeptide (TPR) repeat protein
MQVRFAIGVLVLALAMGVSAPPLQAAPEAGLGRGAGVNFPTSCTPPAQARFNEALAGLHSFWYARAVKEFGDIAQSEPDCPIAYWGVALSLWNQLWAPPRQDALQKGSDAIQKAVALGAKSERERDYINAVAKFYADSDKLDHRTRARAYSDAMEKVYIKYPDDREAAAFYALSMLATIDPLDATYARQREAGKILEAIFREEPNHPAAAHYLIHAYDCGPLAERARPAAEQYAKSTPYVPHAIHMPSHTYVLLGMWKETIDTNMAAGSARWTLERSAWSEAAALPPKPDRFPYIEAIPHYARAIGAARSGHPDAAKSEIEKLNALQDALVKSKNQYWARQVELEAKIANAWTADAEGKPVDALAAMREAADLEGKSETHDTLSPGPIGFTAHEALGELLLKQGQPAEALAAFEESLQLAANRPRSYYGAALAAKQANDSDKAKIYVAKLADVCGVGSAADGAKLREAPSGLPCSALSQ